MASPANIGDDSSLGINPANSPDTKAVPISTQQEVNEKEVSTVDADASSDDRKKETIVQDSEVSEELPPFDHSDGTGGPEVIIRTGQDAAEFLLPLRDDHDPALTFRSLFLASILSAFQAVMSQIYTVSNHLCMRGHFSLISRKFPRSRTPLAFTKADPELLVQTNPSHHPRNLYRPHRLLSWQGMVWSPSPW